MTETGDVVLDIFAGSNTTGAVAEKLCRKWIAFEIDRTYLATSVFRFLNKIDENIVRDLYKKLSSLEISEPITIPQVVQLRIIEDREKYEV